MLGISNLENGNAESEREGFSWPSQPKMYLFLRS